MKRNHPPPKYSVAGSFAPRRGVLLRVVPCRNDRNLQVGLAVVILLFAAYVGGYYGMVFRAYGIGGVGWMTWSAGYRIEALRGIFEPMHHLDRKLRRSYWHQDFPEERLLDIKLACRDFE